MSAVLLALASAGLWGGADFIGGLLTRRTSVVAVLLVTEGVGLTFAVIAVLVLREPVPGWTPVLYGLASGICGIAGLALFYRALAIGTMSIVAPISACGVIIPVVVGLAGGERLSGLTEAGIVLAVIGVILASLEATVEEERHEHTRRARLSILLALLSAIGFGAFFSLSEPAADASVPWALVLVRILAVPFLLGVVLARGIPIARGRDRRINILAGFCDITGTGAYAVAQTLGALGVVSVVAALYPVSTVLLARLILQERLRAVQAAGVVLAMGGVALIAAG